MPFFSSSREGPSKRLRKKAAQEQPVDNNTYTPDAVSNHTIKPSLQARRSIASLSSMTALAQLHNPPTLLTQLTRTTQSLMAMSSNKSKPPAPPPLTIGKPRFVKRNDSPIYRFPSKKEQLLITGVEKLVQLEGDVIPGPGVKPKEKAPEPEVVREEPKKVLKVVNLPDLDATPAFEEVPREQTPPPKPPPLAASRPVPIRQGSQGSIPSIGVPQVATPQQPEPSSPIMPAQASRAFPTYRGVPAYRFGGSIPGPSSASRDAKSIPGAATRSNSTRSRAIRVLSVSPLSQEVHPYTMMPLSPSSGTTAASHSWQNVPKDKQNIPMDRYNQLQHPGLKRRESLKELARATEARYAIAAKKEVEKIQQQNLELHNRMQALEENTLNDTRLLLRRIITLEKANVVAAKQITNGSPTSQVSHQIEFENELAALREENVLLEHAKELLVARVANLELQNEELTRNAESIEGHVKAKEEAETNAESSSRKAAALRATIDALEKQNSLDRERNRNEKEAMRQQAKEEQDEHLEMVTALRQRIAVQEAECAKHLQDLGTKEEERSSAIKERDNLQKELNVLWVELGDISKISEAENAKKITDLESQLAAANRERANDAIEKEKLKKETEVLWAEIRDMHEKQALRLAKAAQAKAPPEVPVSGKSIVSLPVPSEPPQLPEISVPAPKLSIPAAVVRPQTPAASRPGNKPDLVKATPAKPATPLPQREVTKLPGPIKPPQARPTSIPRPGPSIPQKQVPSKIPPKPDFIKAARASRSGIPLPQKQVPPKQAPPKQVPKQPSVIKSPNQIGFTPLLRPQASETALRFRRNALASSEEQTKVKSPKSPPARPSPRASPRASPRSPRFPNSPGVDGSRFGYVGVRGQMGQRPPSRAWKPPGQASPGP